MISVHFKTAIIQENLKNEKNEKVGKEIKLVVMCG